MTLTLKPEELEIQVDLTPGPIIHIFPGDKPEKASKDILKGLAILKKIEILSQNIKELLKDPELDPDFKNVYLQMEKMVDQALLEAENECVLFFKEQQANKENQ